MIRIWPVGSKFTYFLPQFKSILIWLGVSSSQVTIKQERGNSVQNVWSWSGWGTRLPSKENGLLSVFIVMGEIPGLRLWLVKRNQSSTVMWHFPHLLNAISKRDNYECVRPVYVSLCGRRSTGLVCRVRTQVEKLFHPLRLSPFYDNIISSWSKLSMPSCTGWERGTVSRSAAFTQGT